MTDPIADYLTRLRNAIKANHRVVEVPASNLKKEMTRILHEKGYIYRGARIVNWCPVCNTSISGAEVEYQVQAGHF